MKNIHTVRVVLFVAILIFLANFQDLVPTAILNKKIEPIIISWTLGVSAIIIALITRLPLKGLGWSLSFKWIAIGWIVPILYTTVAYSLCWTLGLGHVPNTSFLENSKLIFGMETENYILLIATSFLYITIVQLLPNMLFCFGEELGLRGFLVPEVTKWVSFQNVGWITGVVWLLWYLPRIINGDFAIEGIPIWYQLFCFALLLISTSIILTFLRMKSKSIWPAVTFHAVHNSLINNFFDKLTVDNGMTWLFLGEFGIILGIVTSIFAAFFYFSFRKIDSLKFDMP